MALAAVTQSAGFSWPWLFYSLSPVLVCVWVIYTAAVAAYRLTLHPLSGFPGPKLAGASYCYEFWFDVVLDGRYTREISRLHRKYGPIIRISPDELHCNDPEFVDVVYPLGRHKRNKSRHYLAAMPLGWLVTSLLRRTHRVLTYPKSGAGTADHDHHRLRRAPISRYFSRSRIAENEGLVHQNAQRLCDKLLRHRGQGLFEARAAYSCFTEDVMMTFCFGQSLGNLDEPGWQPTFKGTIDNMPGVLYLMRHLPQLAWVAEWIPLSRSFKPGWLASGADAGSQTLFGTSCKLVDTRQVTIPRLVKRTKLATESDCSEKSCPSIIQALLDSELPASEKTLARLTSEANATVLAGTYSTSAVLALVTYHLLANPAHLARLRSELQGVVSDASDLPSWLRLEQLPYLSGAILEGLRLMYGIASRISVISPDEEMLFKPSTTCSTVDGSQTCYTIPRGYAIGMSAYIMHSDPRLFPDPSRFLPDRWLNEHGQRDRTLERYLLSFAKGNRQCGGIQLAYCELYVTTAALALRVLPCIKLSQTNKDDVEYDHDQMLAMPKRGSKGVRIYVQ